MVQVTRPAHVGLQAQSLSTQAEFYNDRWRLERVEEFGREMYFRADGPDHHVLTPPTQDLEPGVKRALRLRDPDGFLVELVAGVESVGDPFKHADVKPTALDHIVLNVRDQAASENFYRDALGFKLTDRFVGGLSFWACNANHHSLAFGQAGDGNPAFFSYYKDPEGNAVEYTAEVEQITDPNRQPRVMEPYPDQWRTAGSH